MTSCLCTEIWLPSKHWMRPQPIDVLWRHSADWRPVIDRHSGDIPLIDALWSSILWRYSADWHPVEIFSWLTPCDRPTLWRYSADWRPVIDRHFCYISPIDALWSTDTLAIFSRLTPNDRATLSIMLLHYYIVMREHTLCC